MLPKRINRAAKRHSHNSIGETMDEWYETTPQFPTVTAKDKPVIYLPDGREVAISKPFGFANHPNVPAQKIKYL